MRRIRWAAVGTIAFAGCFGFDGPGSDNNFRRPEARPSAADRCSRFDRGRRSCRHRRPMHHRRQPAGRPRHADGAAMPSCSTPLALRSRKCSTAGPATSSSPKAWSSSARTDGQLAAVLCTEMGKLVSEREALTPATVRRPDRSPPIDTGIGRDAGWGVAPDQTRLRELADFDRDRKQRDQAVAPPDPVALARMYLVRAGYHDADLQAAAPLLQQAQGNAALEKQMTGR